MPMNKRDTKKHLFEKGAEPIHLKGYNSTGIQEILQAAGVPKGSFYYHFKNKEDYVLQLMDYFGNYVFGWLDRIFSDTGKSPVSRLRTFFSEFLLFIQEKQYKGGCPIGNLAQEMGDINDAIASKANQLIDGMKTRFVRVLSEAQKTGEISPDHEVDDVADFIINAWQGAIIRTKILRNDTALKLIDRYIFDILLKRSKNS